MMKKLKLFLIIVLSFLAISTNSQNYFNETISENLLRYSSENYPEKIYVHTDKTYYSNEDTVWYSVYLVNGVTHEKTNKSKVLYTELLNEKDSLIDRKQLYINGLNTAGNFKLSKKLTSGNYKLRAYTNYMRNQGANYFFQKEITIWSSKQLINDTELVKNDSIYDNNSSFKPDLNFYPQGGYLVNNLINKVAIKLKDDLYNSINVTGVIVDDNNHEITKFTSAEFGLGEFSIIPEKGKNYFAEVTTNNNTYRYKLPDALENGFVLNAINNQKQIVLELNSNTINGLLGTSLVIHERGKLIFNQNFKEAKNNSILRIPIQKLNSGILHLTLFNSNGQAVCERLVFVENDFKKPTITIKKPKEYFGNRKKVTLKLNVENNLKETLPSILSMTVKDINASPNIKYSENIKTWLLLNSDLRGKIKNPNYFFENENVRKRQYLLDLLMLTHGWRRFTWQEIISNSVTEKKYSEEKGLFISGKTLDMNAPYSIKSVPTRLTFVGKSVHQEPIKKSNNKGEYSYGPFIFHDSIPILLEARLTNFKSEKDTDRKILIVPNTSKSIAEVFLDDSVIKNKKTKTDIDTYLKLQRYLEEINDKFKQYENVLDEVIISSKLKSKEITRDDEMSSRASYGDAFNRYDVSDKNSIGSGRAIDLFLGLPGIRIINDSIYLSRSANVSPLILYDETPIEIGDLSVISSNEISFIDVLTGGDAMMFSSNGAVISIYSKQGNGFKSNRNIKRKPGIIDYKAVGFYTAKEFYAPDHINGIEEQTKADIRTTLHWAPSIIINNEKSAEISFFTSDADSKYLIEIQGITSTGIPLYQTTEITVD